MTRARDYAFEALAEVTSTDPNTGRGELNKALKDIRDQSRIEDSYLLADEIHARSKMYRATFENAALTPTALSKHWLRVFQESEERKEKGMNVHARASECQTCGGDRFVVVAIRKPVQSVWMRERGIVPPEDAGIEEYAPCPDCNQQDASFHRTDGTHVIPPDPARIRQMMND